MMGHVKELTLRVRANEKVVAIVSAIGIGAGGIVGSTAFAPKADAAITDKSFDTGTLIQRFRDWKSGQEREPIEDMLNSSVMEYNDGCNDPTESEELLQFPSSVD